ncbi:MAG: transglutaminase domain-containing protein [Candidatus Cloacimonetes bacterium]|nr:transglutaminase domain-containing protein [Candidatus Cloacimonadota bacterium]
MTRSLMFLIIILAAAYILPVRARYVYDLRAPADPALYRELHSRAETNIKYLPSPLRKQYRKLLKTKPDILMSFLIAYEPSAKLAQADPAQVLENYIEIIELTRRRPMNYTLPFFLSYIAKQTVSDERITPYRGIMLDDGLRRVMAEAKDDVDLYRKVSLWCVERLKFQPTSGRDQTPLDVTQRSLLGRCEEMQILFVAACRTVGLPSRPASVSWWAHIDNNHAWAEVFLDGKWYYTGDMDSAYHPNQTWFSGLVDKTVMVFASGTMADTSDEVLSTDTYGSLINSTVHYSEGRSRTLKLSFVDADHKPIPQAIFAVMVYNWGQLRPLCQLRADQTGTFNLRVGRGAFYISALHKPEKDAGIKALQLIPSSDETEMEVTIVLRDAPLEAQNALLEYPANAVDWKQAPPEWTQAAQAAKENWQSKEDGISMISAPDFAESPTPGFMSLLRKCRNNQAEFLAFSRIHYPLDSDFLAFMADFDDKFCWQADRRQWEVFYLYYLDMKNRAADLSPHEQYYLLNPSVHYEELPRPFRIKRRESLYPAEFLSRATDPQQIVKQTIARLAKKHKINPAKALDGLLSLDAVLRQKHLTSYQFKMLCISALRANGIPAEYARIPDVINIFLEGKWQYYDVVQNQLMQTATAEGSSRPVILMLTDTDGETLTLTEEQISMTMLRNGLFYALNQGFEHLEDGSYRGEFPNEELYLQIGYRSSDSMTGLQLIPIAKMDALSTSEQMVPLDLHLTLRHYPRRWNDAEDGLEPLLSELGGYDVSIFVVGNYNTENCIRIAQRLQSTEQTFLWIGHEPQDMKLMRYLVSPAWQELIIEHPGMAVATLTLVRDSKGEWQMYQGIWENLPLE